MSEYVEEYRHSGSMGAAPFLIPLILIPAAMIMGIIYGYAAVYNPFIYISFLVTMGYGFGLGWVVSVLGMKGKCRNPGFMVVAGVCAGLIGLYTAWVGFFYAFYGQFGPVSYLDMLLSPGDVWSTVVSLNGTGWWNIGSSSGTVSGILLSVFWIIEAGIIIIFPAVISNSGVMSQVFCESTGKWCEFQEGFLKLEVPKKREELSRLKEGDLAILADLYKASNSQPKFLKVNCHRGEAPSTLAAFQIFSVTRVKDDEGEMQENEDELTPMYLVPQEALELFDTWAKTKKLRPKKLPAAESSDQGVKPEEGTEDKQTDAETGEPQTDESSSETEQA